MLVDNSTDEMLFVLDTVSERINCCVSRLGNFLKAFFHFFFIGDYFSYYSAGLYSNFEVRAVSER